MTALDLARRHIGRLSEHLRGVRYQLIGIQASIPPTRQETSPEDLGSDPDAATQVRSIVANTIQDNLDPLIRDLDMAAEYEPSQEGSLPREGDFT